MFNLFKRASKSTIEDEQSAKLRAKFKVDSGQQRLIEYMIQQETKVMRAKLYEAFASKIAGSRGQRIILNSNIEIQGF